MFHVRRLQRTKASSTVQMNGLARWASLLANKTIETGDMLVHTHSEDDLLTILTLHDHDIHYIHSCKALNAQEKDLKLLQPIV